MSLAANKDLVRRFYAQVINERNLDAIGDLLSEDFVHNGEPRGQDGQRAAVEGFLTAFPDLEHEIVLIVAEGDLVAAHQRWRGTHGGYFLGIAPTGRRAEFTSTAVLRVDGDRIAQAWDEVDLLGLTMALKRP